MQEVKKAVLEITGKVDDLNAQHEETKQVCSHTHTHTHARTHTHTQRFLSIVSAINRFLI